MRVSVPDREHYANLRAVSVSCYPGGVRLDFVAQGKSVHQPGDYCRSDGSANGFLGSSRDAVCRSGQTITKADVDEAVTRLQDALREEGLYQAKITIERSRETGHSPDRYHCTRALRPARTRLSKIELLNNTEYADGYLLSRFKIVAEKELTVAKVRSGEERIRKFLEKKGHLSGRVSVRREDYNEAENTIPLTLEVTEGPRVEVQVEGAKFSKGKLKEKTCTDLPGRLSRRGSARGREKEPPGAT